jgi:hypothetical protein
MTRTASRTALAALMLALPAFAQTLIDPEEPIQPTPATPPQRAIPSMPDVDTQGLTDFSLPVRRFYPEGTFLPSRPGRLIKARTGDVIFLPDAAEGRSEPPLVLLAGQRRAQIESAMAAPGFGGRAAVGGQVFVYRSNHYLLPTLFSPITQPAEPDPAATPAPVPGPAPAAEAADPRVEDLIKDLESRRGGPRALAPQLASAQPEADPRPLLPEGTVLVFRRARIVRLPEDAGRIAVAFDNDPDSPAPPPMLVEPCAQLQRLEGLAASRGESVPVKVSGRVLTYKGRNHLLPTFVQPIATAEVVPMQ